MLKLLKSRTFRARAYFHLLLFIYCLYASVLFSFLFTEFEYISTSEFYLPFCYSLFLHMLIWCIIFILNYFLAPVICSSDSHGIYYKGTFISRKHIRTIEYCIPLPGRLYSISLARLSRRKTPMFSHARITGWNTDVTLVHVSSSLI